MWPWASDLRGWFCVLRASQVSVMHRHFLTLSQISFGSFSDDEVEDMLNTLLQSLDLVHIIAKDDTSNLGNVLPSVPSMLVDILASGKLPGAPHYILTVCSRTRLHGPCCLVVMCNIESKQERKVPASWESPPPAASPPPTPYSHSYHYSFVRPVREEMHR